MTKFLYDFSLPQRAYERNGIATCATSVRIDGVGGSRHGAEDKHSSELDYSYRLQKVYTI